MHRPSRRIVARLPLCPDRACLNDAPRDPVHNPARCQRSAPASLSIACATGSCRSSSCILADRSGSARISAHGRCRKGRWPKARICLLAARREFEEETGSPISGRFRPLAPRKQPSGKIVHAWALEGDLDPETIRSNTSRWSGRAGRAGSSYSLKSIAPRGSTWTRRAAAFCPGSPGSWTIWKGNAVGL